MRFFYNTKSVDLFEALIYVSGKLVSWCFSFKIQHVWPQSRASKLFTDRMVHKLAKIVDCRYFQGEVENKGLIESIINRVRKFG